MRRIYCLVPDYQMGMDNSGRLSRRSGGSFFNIFEYKDRLPMDETDLFYEFDYTEGFIVDNFFHFIVSHCSFIAAVWQ